jgi:hypothetical protein
MSYPFKFNIGDLVIRKSVLFGIRSDVGIVIGNIRDPHAREDCFKVRYSDNVVAVIRENGLKLVQKTK